MTITRECMEFDVIIVGGGPAGLSCAIRLAQLNQENNLNLSIALLEKGASIGSHLMSGAVFETTALDELIKDWRLNGAPIHTPVSQDNYYLLSKNNAYRLPRPKQLHNDKNFIISIGELCQWLAQQAEALDVSIFPGFCADSLLFNKDKSAICGVITGDMGRGKDVNPGPQFQAGLEITAKHTVFAEGCRGHLSQQLMQHFNLRRHCDPQTYAIGLKEIWQVTPQNHQSGLVVHSNGWPLDNSTYGGAFMYHYGDNLVSMGLVVGLDYRNPSLDPFEELQQIKRHPLFRSHLEGGECISYGARALNEGGLQSIPQCHFPGGLLVGCSAGFVNVAKIKGNHTAMKSGMLAAEAIIDNLKNHQTSKPSIDDYQQRLQSSWIWPELKKSRNLRPAFSRGLWAGLTYAAFDQYLLRGKAPWTFRNHVDHLSLKPIKVVKPKIYPKPDNTLTFSKSTQVYRSSTNHNEGQLCHLKLLDNDIEQQVNIEKYGSPESHYCPAGVYELVKNENNKPQLQINFQNCLHCKTCDIKDPTQNILWTPPEGGDGPNYQSM